MELKTIQTRRQIRGKWEIVSIDCRLLNWGGEDHPFNSIYEKGCEALERYVRERLLPLLEEIPAEERRRARLHRKETRFVYGVSGELVRERYLSVILTVERRDSEGHSKTESRRVWDLCEECICPLDCFFPRVVAKQYDRWEFSIAQDRVWVLPKSGSTGKWIDQKHIDKWANL